ncbi:MAG: hypothetical protein PHQ27_08070, partial [Victivallales bacterium]|nr:hypothetical protein [Victivallales bacterium]
SSSSSHVTLDRVASIAELLQQLPEGRLRLLYDQFGLKGQGGAVQQAAGTPGIVFMAVMPDANALLLRSYDREAIAQIEKLVKKLDRPAPQVLLEVKLLAVTLNDTEEHAIDFLFNSGDVSGGFANGLTSAGNGQDILKPNAGLVPQGTGLSANAANVTAITDNFSLRAQMLQADGRLTRLATPNLLVADNEASQLFIGSEVTVMEKAQKTVTYTTSGNLQNPNISWDIEAPRRRIGVSLVITPKIHADRTVTIRLLQEHSSLGSLRYNTYSGQTASGDDTESAAASSGSESSSEYFISQDISMQSLTTTTVAKDRQIVVIGGMIEERLEKTLNRIPGLSQIPWLGELLFSRSSQQRVREELLVVIRPYVLLAPGEAEAPSLKLMRELSQHPSATPSLPSLGVSLPADAAKPDRAAPDDPWVKKLWHDVEGWHVDTATDPRVQQAIYEARRQQEREQAEKCVRDIDRDATPPEATPHE